MSLWSRVANIFRGEQLTREIDEEQQLHIDEAIGEGRDPSEARRAFGATLQRREESRDVRLFSWLDSLRADTVFGWRQLWKRKVTSAAAVLSLALAIGACTSAFRLIDALLLRPLPVASPERLYSVFRVGNDIVDNKPASVDSWAYLSFVRMRAAVKDQAELMAISYSQRLDLTYKSDQEMEKANVQYVSGSMFGLFGLRPSTGRLLTPNDDLKPGAHPYAVISYDYWTRRFARDPKIVGRTFRLGDTIFEIVGVGPASFTGTETGVVVDIFLPTMMHPGATKDDWTWHRTLAQLKPGAAVEPIRAKLDATSHAFEEERAKGFKGMTKETIAKFLEQHVAMAPAAAGASDTQHDYHLGLIAMGVLVLLVLMIACANVANLMAAQASSRAREMAMRVSIGAGRGRLVQLVLVESAWLALLAAGIGGVFAWWSAPFVVSRINPPDNPVRLSLPADVRVLAFGAALTLVVTLLFGLAPALRASAVNPANALKGGSDPHARRRLMHALIAMQVAFCFLVLFVAGLFAGTFENLSHRPLGFSPDRILTLETVAEHAATPVYWDQVADHLRSVPGVDKVALCGFPLLGGDAWNGFVSVNGAPPGPVLAYFISVSPGWMEAMKIPLKDGRDFRESDTSPGEALVNENFVKMFFPNGNPLGQSIAKGSTNYQVVGVVGDAPYKNVHEPTLPVAFVPMHAVDGKGALQTRRTATFIVRTLTANPMAMASTLRREVPRARPDFRVSNIHSQADLVNGQTLRERLLAMLALFFAGVALLLGSVGLYGVLDYSVLQRRREIGIRMAIGAQAGAIARGVTADAFLMVLTGAVIGLGLGMASVKYVSTLLYEVQPTDPAMLAVPVVIIFFATLLAALPAVIRAVRIDPARILRSE
ncbi:MAG TPA: ABC transporter permease [Candidatus Sulfopaludibacter sp.]|jgi:predicted permease|nr:ABC transporter permease [Candidatus Sulfopaludibacter sp.]